MIPEWTERASCIGQWEDFDWCIETLHGTQAVLEATRSEQNKWAWEKHHRAKKALAICWSECPVRQQCLSHALDNNLLLTIRGGYLPPELEVMAKDYQKEQNEQF